MAIVVAGMEGALPSVVAGLTSRPSSPCRPAWGTARRSTAWPRSSRCSNACAPGVVGREHRQRVRRGVVAHRILRAPAGGESMRIALLRLHRRHLRRHGARRAHRRRRRLRRDPRGADAAPARAVRGRDRTIETAASWATKVEVRAADRGLDPDVLEHPNVAGLGARSRRREGDLRNGSSAGWRRPRPASTARKWSSSRSTRSGGVDSIVDIVGTALALTMLGVERVFASAVPTGTGDGPRPSTG